jgi:hypothetical protein
MTDDTTRAIATLLNLAAVGIKYPIRDICICGLRVTQPKQLIKTDTIRAIGQSHNLLGGGHRDAADNHEIVAQRFHFGETDLCHAGIIGVVPPQSLQRLCESLSAPPRSHEIPARPRSLASRDVNSAFAFPAGFLPAGKAALFNAKIALLTNKRLYDNGQEKQGLVQRNQ